MWRSRIRLRRTSVFSYLTGSLLCFWCCVLLVFFSFSLPLSWPPSAVKRRNQPVRDAKKRGKALALSFVLSALHRQFVILANHERSTAKKREGERERARLISLSLSILLSLFPFSLSLSLSLSIFLYISWLSGLFFLLFRLPVLARFSVAKAFLAGRREEGSVKHQVVCAYTLV